MLRSFFLSRPWALWAWGGLAILLISVSAQVHILVKLNDWYKEFYDLLQSAAEVKTAVDEAAEASDAEAATAAEELGRGKLDEFWLAIRKFYQLAFIYITIAVFSSFFSRHWVFRWRQAMTFFYIPLWAKTEKEIEGSSQRIQEDTQRFARIVESLGLELFESFLKVIAFITILWSLSVHVKVDWLENIPGSLVWLALACSLGGMVISFLVGIRLPGLEYNNQKVEAAFRKKLVYGEDGKEHVSVPSMWELFVPIRYNYFRLFLHYGYFDFWRIFYLQSIVLIPFITTAESLFLGAITLGVIIQASNAFDKVIDSFSYFIRSWTTVTEFLSVIKRLREFEIAIGYRQSGLQTAEDVQEVKPS